MPQNILRLPTCKQTLNINCVDFGSNWIYESIWHLARSDASDKGLTWPNVEEDPPYESSPK